MTLFKLKTDISVNADLVIDSIVKGLFPETWQRLGGSGTIVKVDPFAIPEPSLYILVSNTPTVESSVTTFLEKIAVLKETINI